MGNFMMYECKTPENVEKGIKEIARVLKDDGRALLVTMDEQIHMTELYSILQQAIDQLKQRGITIDANFPKQAPAILPFCVGNATPVLEQSFGKITTTRIPNKLLVNGKLSSPNESVSGPEFVVQYLQSLAFVQAAMKDKKLPAAFFDEIQKIVSKEIETNGVFKISRCDVIYDCAEPKRN
jgi:hypothetical protein